MKKRAVSFVLLAAAFLLFFSMPIVSAQTYSSFNRFTDNVKLFFSSGDSKVKLALGIREKEVNSALESANNGNTEKAVKNLEKAQNKLKIVQDKISLKNSEEVKASVEKIKEKLNKDNLSEEFKEYKLEEEKIELTAQLTLKTFEYCKTLAQEDYSLMLKEEKCNPDTAQKGLENELRELKDIQDKSFVQLMLDVRSCIDDPGTCKCEENTDISQKAKCEKLVALAVKCEYTDDETACAKLDSMKPAPGDGFAKSFIPDFLTNLFSKKHDMVEYNISHSDGVPEECWDKNDKPECEQYAYLKETRLDWDEHGNFIGTNKAKGIQEPVPTMQESVPQCFDKENNFLKEKCGKVTIVKNDKGLINYITEKGVENIIDKFENNSKQNTIDVNGTTEQTITNKIKEEINQINNQIATITYAEGTGPGGESGVVIKGDKPGITTNNNSNGDNGLKPEVKTSVAGGGDNGLKPEIASGEHENNEPLPNPDLNQINPDLYNPDARAPGDTIDETYDDEIVNSAPSEGTNTLAP